MSIYKTGIQIDSEVHKYIFSKKRRTNKTFNMALRRELGLSPLPEDSEESPAEAAD